MNLVTWNTQWCCGLEGVVNPRRIVDVARAMVDFDPQPFSIPSPPHEEASLFGRCNIFDPRASSLALPRLP